ncbi:MAG: STY4526/YPO1902 family pathogenicity island replication protein [Rubrivivax sp.]
MLLVTHFVAWLEAGCQLDVSELSSAGLSPQLIDRLRRLSVTDAMRLATGPCGLTISVDCAEIQGQLARVERQRSDRAQFERLVIAGASLALVSRLFGVSTVEVRRQRRLIAPEAAIGGRPRVPDEEQQHEIQACWADLAGRADLCERDRWLLLHEQFPDLPVVSLEDVVQRAPAERVRCAA